MNKRCVIVMLCCLSMLSLTPNAFGGSKNKEKDLHIEEFGVKTGKRINKGFVFYDGRYIDTPYVVSQKGLGIFINDVMIRRPIKWPIPKLVRPVQDTDPGFPEGMTEHSTWDDGIFEHALKKYDYLLQHYSQEVAIQKFVEYYRSFPCIKKVEYENSDKTSILITDSKGEPMGIDFVSRFPDTRQKFDKASISQGLEESRRYIERRLKNNTCYFFFSRGGEASSRTDAQELLRMVQILRSKKSVETKIKQIEIEHRWSKESLTKLVTNFSASPQLEKRLYKQIKSRQKKEEKDSE